MRAKTGWQLPESARRSLAPLGSTIRCLRRAGARRYLMFAT